MPKMPRVFGFYPINSGNCLLYSIDSIGFEKLDDNTMLFDVVQQKNYNTLKKGSSLL